MKKLSCIVLILFVIGFTQQADAQLSKKEKKEWKKRAKEFKKNPAELQEMSENLKTMEARVSSLDGQVASLQSRLSEKDAKISELTDEIRQLENQLASARAEVQRAKKMMQEAQAAAPTETSSSDYSSGVVFKVQIGAFRNKDLKKYFENHENFGGEVTEEGIQKITLGVFRDYWEADTFKKYLREMGVHDAWIVPYKNGERVAMKDVLEGVI